MASRDMVPQARGTDRSPAPYRDTEQRSLMSLRREIDRLFDGMFRDFDLQWPLSAPAMERLASFNTSWPNVEIAETEHELKVTAEIPGIMEKDVEVLLEDGMLTLRGEKHAQTDDKQRQFSERYYGRFERRIPLGSEVERDKVMATFKDGVLTVTLPKSAIAQSRVKRIAINDSTKVH